MEFHPYAIPQDMDFVGSNVRVRYNSLGYQSKFQIKLNPELITRVSGKCSTDGRVSEASCVYPCCVLEVRGAEALRSDQVPETRDAKASRSGQDVMEMRGAEALRSRNEITMNETLCKVNLYLPEIVKIS